MKSQAVAVAVLLAAVALCHAQVGPVVPRCGPGEVLKQCQSSTCAELSCAHPRPPTKCTYDCVTGCFCADGFFRNSARRCVPRALCS
ncbi:hypothetical protein V5799_003103 [Amblyomma americanum]|uniref:TIL domain-containing protein n=1 Tax=Amblyomma americanum TaxID=6943 RepID=A0AAQ4D9W9_AMBAM